MGRIKNYYKDFKENFKLVVAEDKESKTDKNEVADSQVIDELKKEWDENKKDNAIIGISIIGLLLGILLIIGILYLIFNKPIIKMVNGFVNRIPINISENNNTDNNNSNTNSTSSFTCTNSFTATYILNNEIIDFSSGGSYSKSLDDDLIDFGNYTIDKSVITVTISSDNNKNYQITYNITKDCSKITETSTGQVYQRQ